MAHSEPRRRGHLDTNSMTCSPREGPAQAFGGGGPGRRPRHLPAQCRGHSIAPDVAGRREPAPDRVVPLSPQMVAAGLRRRHRRAGGCVWDRVTPVDIRDAPATGEASPEPFGGRVFATEPRRQRASRPPRPPGTSSSARPPTRSGRPRGRPLRGGGLTGCPRSS